MRGSLLLIFALGLMAQPAASSSYRLVEQWAAADGLPTENIASLAIDAERQLWMATYDGIVRYQGFDFQHHNRASQPALRSNRFAAAFAAPIKGVIIQSEGGDLGHLTDDAYLPLGRAARDHVVAFGEQIWFVCAETQTLWSWHQRAGLKQRSERLISALSVDHFKQRLLLGTSDGEILALAPGQPDPQLLLNTGLTAILGLAGGPDDELLALDAQQIRLFQLNQHPGRPIQSLTLEASQIIPVRAAWTQDGWLLANLISSDGAGPHRLNGAKLTRLPVPQATSPAADRSPARIELMDHHQRRWINDGQNLWRDGQLVFSSDERIVDFMVDPFDQIWLAQPTAGLRLVKQTMTEMLGTGPGELADPNISLVAEHEGALLVGSWVQLSRLDPDSGEWTTLMETAAREVLPDEGGLLVGSHGLCRLERPGDCQALPGFPAPTAEVLMLHRDAAGQLWAGTGAGLFRRDSRMNWQPEPVHAATTRVALERADGRLLFGTNGHGILIQDGVGTSGDQLLSIGPEQGLPSPHVRALLAVPGGGVLVGTEDAGLCLLSDELKVQRCLSSADGLPHHSVHFMVPDEVGRLWVNSNGGIYWMELESLLAFMKGATMMLPDFYRLGQRQGMTSVEGNGGVNQAGARTADGRIWFPNQRGLVAIRPGNDEAGKAHPLTPRLRVLSPLGDAAIHLPRHARHLEVELTANALAEPENVQFRYRFGSDADWTEIGPRRNLNFRHLGPGRQTLEVSARHINTPWSDTSARLDFSAGHRLHEYPPLRALLLCLALALPFGVWQVEKKRRAILEKAVADRSARLSLATEQVASLADAFQRVDAKHRTALQAVSRELKSALSAAMEPLMRPSGRVRRGQATEAIQTRAQTLAAMLDQIDTFAEEKTIAQPGRKGNAPRATATSPAKAAPDRHAVDRLAVIRMEVLLHLADPDFSVDRLAERLGVSRSVLYRQAAELSAVSPAELIRDIRLDEAANQLRDTNQQISIIADATGFRSVSAFSRAFTKKTGVSPRQWRQQEQSGQGP
ncbi:MAG: helix-turn-helix domain-containing protein [Wenzhouxiangella sp.]